jgi:Tfp pilus assembly protein PilF
MEYNLALALDQSGDLIQERVALQRAIELRPGFAAAENQLGYLEAHAGNATAAEQHFRKALEIVPRFAEASNNLGTLLGQQGRDTEAEVRFRSAVSANPRYTAAWINLGATLASESHFAEARAAVDCALKIDPQNSDALQLRNMLASSPSAQDPPVGSALTSGSSSNKAPH